MAFGIPFMAISLAVLFLGGLFIYVFRNRIAESAGKVAVGVSLVSTFLFIPAFYELLTDGQSIETAVWSDILEPFGLQLDAVAFPITFAVVVLGFLSVVYAVGYTAHTENKPTFFANQLFFIMGMIWVTLATNLIEFFIAWEIMLVPSYFLILFWGLPETRKRTALKFWLYTQAGAVSILIGFGLLYAQGGTFVLANIVASGDLIFKIIFILLAAGFLVKLNDAAISLSFWVCALGVVTMFYGGFMALAQVDIKRLLAYSSVSQMGYVLFALGTVTAIGVSGGMFHLINHAFSKGLLFMTAGAVIHQTGKRNIKKMGGLSNKMPITAFAAGIGMMSIAASPPLSGFISEWMMFLGGFQAAIPVPGAGFDMGFLILTLLAVSSSILSAAYMLRFFWRVFLGPHPEELEDVKESPRSMTIPMIILAILIVIFGIFPSLALDVIVPAFAGILGP